MSARGTDAAAPLAGLANLARFIATHPLTRRRKARAFARLLGWQVASRLRRELIVPWIEGTRLCVRRGMTGATGNIYCGLHEFEDMAFVLHFLRPQDSFVDIGANVGSYTILASGVCRARTFAFEPDPETFRALSCNIRLNELDALVIARECALGPGLAKVEFTVGLDTVNHVATSQTIGPTRIVTMQSLDHALDGARPSLMKLDVEGFEHEVLRGAAATIADPKLEAIILESASPAVTECLRAAGFSAYSYEPFTRVLGPDQMTHHRQNTLFVRNRDFVRQRIAEAKPVHVLGCCL